MAFESSYLIVRECLRSCLLDQTVDVCLKFTVKPLVNYVSHFRIVLIYRSRWKSLFVTNRGFLGVVVQIHFIVLKRAVILPYLIILITLRNIADIIILKPLYYFCNFIGNQFIQFIWYFRKIKNATSII